MTGAYRLPNARKSARQAFVLLAMALSFALKAETTPETGLPDAVRRALAAAKIPESAVSVVVQPLNATRPVLTHNAAAAMNPASVMKLVTAFAALEILGPGKRWQTSAWAAAEPGAEGVLTGALFLRGGGDPAFSMEAFTRLLRRLRARGVRHIEGDLVLDRSLFSLPARNPGAFDRRPLRAYNVFPDALLIDGFAQRFTFVPENGAVRAYRDTPNERLVSAIQLKPGVGICDGWRDRLGISLTAEGLRLEGQYPVSCGERTLLLSPLSPETHIDGLFRALWRELGGTFAGKTRNGTIPVNAIRLASQESPPLSDLIRDMNKWSNNVMARHIFLALGDKTPLTEEGARQRVTEWLAWRGLRFPELVLENGSGLSRIERISAESMNRLLITVWQSEFMPEFLASLPIVAVDGTLQKRLNGTPSAGRARLKTGTLEGVRTMAGYAQDEAGRRYALTFLMNHPRAADGQTAMDALIRYFAEKGL